MRVLASTLLAVSLSTAVLTGCASDPGVDIDADSGGQDDPELVDSTGDAAKADSQSTTSTYYSIKEEGAGFSIARVNQPNTKCADGTRRDACHIAKLDFSRMAFDFSEVAQTTNAAKYGSVYLRGALAANGTLGVSEVWTPPYGITPSGPFYRIRTISAAGSTRPRYHLAKLNSTLFEDVTKVDLGQTGTAEVTVNEAFKNAAAGGAVVRGTFSGSGSRRTFKASQVLIKAVHVDTGDRDLGEIRNPGSTMADTTEVISETGSLTFSVKEDEKLGLGDITITPAGMYYDSTVLEDDLGDGRALIEYSFVFSNNVAPGTVFTVKTRGGTQSRNDPNWAFSFQIQVK